MNSKMLRLLRAAKALSIMWEGAPWSEEYGQCEFCTAQSIMEPLSPHTDDCAWVEFQAAIKNIDKRGADEPRTDGTD